MKKVSRKVLAMLKMLVLLVQTPALSQTLLFLMLNLAPRTLCLDIVSPLLLLALHVLIVGAWCRAQQVGLCFLGEVGSAAPECLNSVWFLLCN